MKKQFLSFVLAILTLTVVGQENEKPFTHSFKGTRLVNSQSAGFAEQGELLLLIQHRFGDISGGLYEFFGLDQASMRLGFEYGFSNYFNVGIGRSTYLKTYDIFAKIGLLNASKNLPLSIVFVTGASVPTMRDFYPANKNSFADKYSANAALIFAGTIQKVSFQVAPGYLRAGFVPQIAKEISTATLSGGASLRLSRKVAVNIEYLHPFNNELPNQNALSAGVDIQTSGHLFQLIISNSQQMFTQALYTNTMGSWTKGHIYFGFNLVREFDINKPLLFN